MSDQFQYAIAGGYNVALGSLNTLVKTKISPDTYPFLAPLARGYYNLGNLKYRTDGSVFLAGFTSTIWEFAYLSFAQYNWLYNTILSSALSGPATVYTKLGSDTYFRMNTVLILPKLPDQDATIFTIKKPKIQLTRLATAS